MALGKPLIASRAGGLPEVVGDAGLLFDTGDISALRAALERLATDEKLRARLGREGSERVRRLFAPERAARQLAQDYRAILARDSGG